VSGLPIIWQKLNRGLRNAGVLCILPAERMSISEIAAVLGVSKSYLYGLVKAYPAENPN
jgi:transposase